jgi:hypothetical protein
VTPAEELKTLRLIARQMANPPSSVWSARWVFLLFWVGSVLSLLLLMRLNATGVLSANGLTFASVVVGALVTAFRFMQLSKKQWPVVSPFIDKERLTSRIHELEI